MSQRPSDRGPFSQARQEHDSSCSYFLPELFKRIEADKPIYLVGTRGAGKTTFLKALTSSERLSNQSLQRQLRQRDGALFSGHYIGVYMQLPKSLLYVFDRWIPETEDDRHTYSDLVGLYLSLNWAELMCDAVAELTENEVISVSMDDEQAAVAKLCGEYTNDAFRQHLDVERVRTLRAAAKAYREIRRTLQRRGQARRPLEPIFEEFPVERLHTVAQFVASTLLHIIPSEGGRPWSFRICIDEAESMTERQHLTMNSIVRNSEWRLLPVVSLVSLSKWANNTDSPLTMGKPDVEDVPLDQLGDAAFRTFAEGVATVRMQDAGEENLQVDLSRILGPLDINALLEQIIGRSTARRGHELLAAAKRNQAHPYFKETQSKSPPIYQTYLVERLNLDVPDVDTPAWEQRAQQSAEIRKRIVAAYMSICQELNTKPWYASVDMVIQMSDGCIRDFLWQMDELWISRRRKPARFLEERIPDTIQDKALKRASEQKMARIAGLVITGPRQAERLVDGLGTLTAELQRPRKEFAASDTAHLRSSEPGYWVLPAYDVEPMVKADPVDQMYRLIHDATEAGYLRKRPNRDGAWCFRVHTSLAAHYGFSYRGAQYEVKLEPQDLIDLCEAATTTQRKQVVASLYRRLRGGNMSLLVDGGEDD